MNHEGVLDKHDVAPSLIQDEILARMRSEDGLWFTARHVIGMTRLSERIHRPSQMWFQRELSIPDAIIAFRDPRASGKTSGITISTPFWVWAQVPTPGTPIQGVNTRLAITAPKKEMASYNFLARIMRIFDDCAAYRTVCPWVQTKSISLKNGLLLHRDQEVGDISITPIGMESVSTSYHFDIAFIDDPIHDQNYFSEIEVRRIVEWMYLSRNLVRSERGTIAFIGNFWRLGDVQDQLRPTNPYFRGVRVWERGLTGCKSCLGGREPGHQHDLPLIPVTLLNPDGTEPGPEAIDAARESMPTYVYMAQCENNPIDPTTLHFDKNWLRTWTWRTMGDGQQAVTVGLNPEQAQARRRAGEQNVIHTPEGWYEIISLDALDFYILVDPAASVQASADHSRFAIAVIAIEKRGPRKFLIDEYAKNAPPHENIGAIIDMYLRWFPRVRKIGVESVGYQATIPDTILSSAHARGIGTMRESDLVAIPRLRQEGAQEDRIRYALSPLIESGNFHIHPTHRIFKSEFESFGVKGAKHDLLDAISNGPRVWGARGRSGRPGVYDSSAVTELARRRRIQGTDETGY